MEGGKLRTSPVLLFSLFPFHSSSPPGFGVSGREEELRIERDKKAPSGGTTQD